METNFSSVAPFIRNAIKELNANGTSFMTYSNKLSGELEFVVESIDAFSKAALIRVGYEQPLKSTIYIENHYKSQFQPLINFLENHTLNEQKINCNITYGPLPLNSDKTI